MRRWRSIEWKSVVRDRESVGLMQSERTEKKCIVMGNIPRSSGMSWTSRKLEAWLRGTKPLCKNVAIDAVQAHYTTQDHSSIRTVTKLPRGERSLMRFSTGLPKWVKQLCSGLFLRNVASATNHLQRGITPSSFLRVGQERIEGRTNAIGG